MFSKLKIINDFVFTKNTEVVFNYIIWKKLKGIYFDDFPKEFTGK
jgi:hypothetical protein